MKNCQLILIILLLSLAAMAQAGPADNVPRLADPAVLEALRATDTPGLPKNLTPGERPHLRLPDLSLVPRVPPVAEHLHTASEFERNEAIIMRWGDRNSVLTEMIVPITTGDSLARVMLVVASSAQQSSAANTLASAGANLAAVEFVIAPSNSVWIRDYGPRFSSADNERIVVDHEYDRPRPLDNQIPAAIASHLGEELYDMPIRHGGGNFHLFANDEAYMADMILDENPGYTAQDVIDLYADYQGVELTLLPSLPASFDSTQHLDMWFLPVDDDTVIIGDYNNPPPGVGAAPASVINATENTVSLMESRGYTVLRTPGWRTTTHITYTNSVIVNDLVLICRFNGYPAQNAQALAVYEQAFPGRDIIQVDCSSIINSAGALHCIVKHQPAPTFRMEVDQPSAMACVPEVGSEELTIEVSLQAINGFNDPVTLLALGEPTGVTSQFEPATLAPPGETTWTLTVDASASVGTSDISLFGDDGMGPSLPVDLSLTLEAPLAGPGLVNPPDLAEDIALQPVLEWNDLNDAFEYRIQLATDPDFDHIVVDEWVSESLLAIDLVLDSGEMHYWRVLAGNACGPGAWSEARQFRTRLDPTAEVTPAELVFEVNPNSTGSDTLFIANVGDGELEWAIATQSCSEPQAAPWLTIDANSGSTLEDQSSTVEVNVDTTGLEPGIHQGGLCVTTNQVDAEPVSVPVWLEVPDLPPGQLQIEPVALVFGNVATGSSDWRDLTLANVAEPGTADLVIGQVQIISGQSDFSLDEAGTDCGETLSAQAECTIRVRFAPASLGARPGVLRVIVDAQTTNISLGGNGVEPEAEIFSDRFEVPD